MLDSLYAVERVALERLDYTSFPFPLLHQSSINQIGLNFKSATTVWTRMLDSHYAYASGKVALDLKHETRLD